MAKRTASQSLTLSLMPKEGQTTYTWIRYADSETGSGMSNDPTGKKYIGIATNKLVSTESTNPEDYVWSLIKGEDGVPGSDGDSMYVWIAYSDHSNGVPMYQQPRASTEYIGIAANKSTAEESTNPADYTWSKFKGDQGVPGIDGQDAKYVYLFSSYQVNPGCEISVNGGENLIQGHRGFNVITLDRTTLAMLEYRWFDTYSDRTGENVMENMAAYLDSLDDSVLLCVATYDWVDWLDNIITSLQKFGLGTLPHTNRGYYPFVFVGYKGIPEGYAKYALHSGPSSSNNKAEMSVYIANGSIAFSPAGTAGIGVEDVVNYYAVSNSSTTAPTSGWSTTPPQMTETNRYLWNYEVTTFTDGSTQETRKSLIGVHGASGANGVGIESIIEYFLASSDASGVTTSTSGWTTDVQDTTNEKPYLWNYEIVRYTDNTTYTSKPRIIGTKGETVIGKDGYTLEVDRTNYAIPCEADGTPLDSELNNGQLKNAIFSFEAFYGGKQLTLSYNTSLTKSNNLISSESSVVTVAQKENNNFNFLALSLGRFIRPNTTYTLSVGSSQMTAGTSTHFTFYLYDRNTATNYGGGSCTVSSSRQVVTFTTNDKPTGDDGQLLVYAGPSGATAGKAIKITNIQLEEGNSATDWAAGSKGKGSWTFGTPVASAWRNINGSSCGINSVSADTGYCDINFNLEGEITLTKRLSFVKQKKGEQGIDGGSSYKLITGVTTLDSMHGEDYLGYWYAGGENGLGGRPTGVDAFSLQVLRTAAGYYTQVLYPSNELTNTMWIRTWNASTGWTEWVEKGKEGQSARYIYLRGTAHSSQHFDGVTTANTPALVRTSGGETNLSISSRGLTVITLDRHELTVVTRQTFDTITESATRNQQMADLLNSLDDSVFLCIVSFDAFYLNSAHGGDVVIEALKAFGLGTVDRARLNYRCPFAFLGQKGLQAGYAYMAEGGDSLTYPDSHDVEISAYVAEGAIAYAPEGRKGSMIRMRGEWKVGQTYVNQQDYADVVLYDGSYYICIAESGAVSSDTNPKTDTTNWAPFNDFENIATSVLLANKGYINVLGAGKAFVGQTETGTGWELTQGHIKHTGTGLELTSDGKLKVPDYGAVTIGGSGVKVAAGNLIKDSGRLVSTTEYFMTGYSVYTDLVVGQKYTFVAKGNDASDTGIGLWDNRGQDHQGNAKFDENGLAIIYFTYSKSSSATTSSLSMYHYNNPGTQCTVEWAMLFEGHSLPPTSWEPAPQEQDTGVGANFITYSETNEENKVRWWNVNGGTTTYHSDGILPHYYYVYPGVAGAGLCTPPLCGALVSGKYYTLSFYGYGSTAFTIDRIYLMGTENGNIAVSGTINVPTGSVSNYPRTTFTFRAPKNATQCSGILLGVNAATTVGINIANVKLELGATATAWTAETSTEMKAYKSYVSSELTVLDNKISQKVSQTDYNALNQRVSSAESTIEQHADQIAQKVEKTTYDAFTGSVNTQISQIKQQAGQISETVTDNYQQLTNEINKAAPYTEVTLDATALDPDTWYPVTFKLPTDRLCELTLKCGFYTDSQPPWSSHSSKRFSVICRWLSNGNGWGQVATKRTIIEYVQGWVTDDVTVAGSIGQMTELSQEYIYVRGGGKYKARTEGYAAEIKLHSTATPTEGTSTQTISPITTAPVRPVPDMDKVQQAADTAQAAADAAQADADAANSRLESWAADGVITPMEKDSLKDELARIKSDHDEISLGYTKYGLGTPTSYNNAYNTYKSQLDTFTASSTWGNVINIPTSFRTNQTTYYTQRTNALNAIAAAAKDYADEAGALSYNLFKESRRPPFSFDTAGGTKTFVEDNSIPPGVYERWNITKAGDGGYYTPSKTPVNGEKYSWSIYVRCSRALPSLNIGHERGGRKTVNLPANTWTRITHTFTASGSSASAFVIYPGFQVGDVFDFHSLIMVESSIVPTWVPSPYETKADSDAAKADAEEALDELSNMKSDSKISPQEKTALKQQMSDVKSEYAQILNQAKQFSAITSTQKNAYTTAYNSAITAFNKYTATSPEYITVGSDYDNIAKYYTARQTILDLISDASKGLIDDNFDKNQLLASMAAGKMLSANSDPTFKKGSNGIIKYNNSGVDVVTVSRTTLSGVPNDSGYVISIVNNGGTSSPGRGGFTFSTESKANYTTIARFIAKIPTGYKIYHASNSHGNSPKEIWLTEQEGTGDWKEYAFYCKCGSTGTFSSYNYFYLEGSPNAVTWYLAYATVFDVSSAGVSNLDISNLQEEVDNAAQQAQTANTAISNMSSDNILSPIEKQQVKREWEAIQDEYTRYSSIAGSLIGDVDVSGAKNTYTTRYNNLNTYITPLLSSLTTQSSITGSTFRSYFTNYYDARTALLNAITNCAGGVLDTRSTNETPGWYLDNFDKRVIRELKYTSIIGLSIAFPNKVTETFCVLETYIQWGDISGGYPRQTAIANGRLFTRQGTSSTTWSDWGDSTTTIEMESAIDRSATDITLRVDSKLVNLFKDGSFENDVNTVGNTDATLGNSDVSFPSWHDIYEPYDDSTAGAYRNIMPFGSRVMAVRNWTTGGQNRVIIGQHVPIEPLKKYTIIVWRHDGGTRLAEDGYRWLNVRTPATSPTKMETHIATSQPSWTYGWHQEVYVTGNAPSWAQSMQVFFGTKNDTATRDKAAWSLFDGLMVIEGDLTQNGGKYIPESYFGDNQTDMSESLYRTGINVASGEVTVNADRFRITDSTGVPKLLFDSDSGLLRTELIDTDALKVKNIEAGTGTIDFLSAPENVTGGLGVYIGRGAFEEVIASSNSVGTARSGNVNLTFQHATGAVGGVNSGMQENTLYTIQGKQTCSVYISGSIRTTLNAYGQLRDSNDAHILSDELGMADVAVSIWIKRGTIYEKLIGSTGVHAPTFKVDAQGQPYDLKETVSKSTTINLAETLLIEAGTSVSIVARYSYRLDRKQDTNTARATLYIPSPTSLNVSVNTRVVALCADGMLMQSSTSNAMHLIPGTYSDQTKGFRFESDNIIQFAAPLAPTKRSQKDVTTPNSGLGGDSSDIAYWAGYDLINYTGATSSYFYLPDVTISAIINHFRLYTKNTIIIRPAGSGLSGLGANKEEYRTQANHLYTLDYLSDDTWCIS